MRAPLRPLLVTLVLRTVRVLLVPFGACSAASEARGHRLFCSSLLALL